MFKTLTSSLLLACSSLVASAQSPILTAATINPIRGDRFIINNCDTLGVTPQTSGASQVWDFSSLSLTSRDTISADPTYWTPHASLFPSANIALVPVGATATAVSIYSIASSTKFSQDGIYYNSTTPAQYATYTDPVDILQYPFEYMNSFSDSYTGTALFLGTIPATQSGTTFVQADAYGSLTLPGLDPGISTPVTYANTVRVHSTQNYTDHASLFSLDTTIHYTLETYTWYSPGYHNALLTIATGTGGGADFKTVNYSAFEDVTHEGVASVNNADVSFSMFPNPSVGTLNITYNTVAAQQLHISIVDLLGREIAVIANKSTIGDQHITYNTTNIPKGLYLIRFQSAAQTITRKIEIQ